MSGDTTGPAAGRASSAPVAEDPDEVVNAVLTASRVLVGVSARSLAEVEDTITITQFRTLVVLGSERDINLNRLAEVLGVNASTAMRTVDRLLAAGLVTRQANPASRREVVLGLTEEGSRVVRDVTERRRAEIARVLSRMPAKRRGDLVRAFRAFADAAGEPAVSGGGPVPLGW